MRIRYIALLLFAYAGAVGAHGLQRSVGTGQAVVITLADDEGGRFAFEAYEVYRTGEDRPFQAGQSDRLGRIAFLPDQPGSWRIRAFSKDGHGLDFTLTTDAAAKVVETDKPLIDRHARQVVGIAALLGLFGFLAVFLKRRKSST